MDVGGVQESRSQLCYRKKPLTLEKKKEKKPHDFWEKDWGFGASELFHLLSGGKSILIGLNNLKQDLFRNPLIQQRGSRSHSLPTCERKGDII